jgi:hypothetical protein
MPGNASRGRLYAPLGRASQRPKSQPPQVTEVEDLHPGPEAQEADQQSVQQPGLETQGEGQDSYRPPPDAIGVVRVDVEDLGHQPDARSIEETSQKEDILGEGGGVPPIAQGEAGGVGQGDSDEDDRELGPAGELAQL